MVLILIITLLVLLLWKTPVSLFLVYIYRAALQRYIILLVELESPFSCTEVICTVYTDLVIGFCGGIWTLVELVCLNDSDESLIMFCWRITVSNPDMLVSTLANTCRFGEVSGLYKYHTMYPENKIITEQTMSFVRYSIITDKQTKHLPKQSIILTLEIIPCNLYFHGDTGELWTQK